MDRSQVPLFEVFGKTRPWVESRLTQLWLRVLKQLGHLPI